MNITRHNYEEYFLLYVDNELGADERAAVENFVQENPDLREELVMLQQSVIRPDQQLVFEDKSSLLKNVPATNPVNETNYEEYFVLYGDDELNNEQKDLVEQFVYRHPQYQSEFELIQQARLTPDTHLVFPNKASLYRYEHDKRVIAIRWWRIAAAAVVLIFLGGLTWFTLVKQDTPPVKEVAKNNSTDTTVPGKTIAPAGTGQRENKESFATTTDPDNTQPPVVQEEKKEAALVANNSTGQQESRTTTSLTSVPSEKIIPDTSNIATTVAVLHTEPTRVLPAVKDETRTINIEAPKAIAGTTTAMLAKTDEMLVPEEDMGNDSFTPTANKKNKMRGFFRKVTRVFERNTNMEPGENNKGGIRIANLEIALK